MEREYVVFAQNLSRNLVKQIAALYCQIWQEPPWNEDFWTKEKVVSDFDQQMSYDGAIGFIAIEEEEVIGFVWGYLVDKEKMRAICGNQSLDFHFSKGEKIFYIDELGVAKNKRKVGIGSALTFFLIREVKLQGIRKILVRTDKQAVEARKLYRKFGFRELLSVRDAHHPERSYWLH